MPWIGLDLFVAPKYVLLGVHSTHSTHSTLTAHSQHSQHSPPRTPVSSQRTPAKRSLFTSSDYANSDDYCADTHTWHTGIDSESTVSLDSPLPKHIKPSTSDSTSTSTPTQTAKRSSKTAATGATGGRSASAAKKAVASPGTRPITSFFARNPAKDHK